MPFPSSVFSIQGIYCQGSGLFEMEYTRPLRRYGVFSRRGVDFQGFDLFEVPALYVWCIFTQTIHFQGLDFFEVEHIWP